MGTNYYLESTARLPPAFGRPRIHIGKSSAGWCFALHAYPHFLCDYEVSEVDHHRPTNLGQWLALMEATSADGSARIVDEYGAVVSVDEMVETITRRSWMRGEGVPAMYGSWAEFHQINQSEPGPNGLVRHKMDGKHCVAHGDGTWDLIVGEFS